MSLPPEKALEELFKFRLAQLRSDSEYATSTISQAIRVMAYGLVVLLVPLVTADPARIPLVLKDHPLSIVMAALLGAAGILADLLQNYCADICARQELSKLSQNLKNSNLVISSPADFMTPKIQSRAQEARRGFYYAKSIFVFLGVFVVFCAIYMQILKL